MSFLFNSKANTLRYQKDLLSDFQQLLAMGNVWSNCLIYYISRAHNECETHNLFSNLVQRPNWNRKTICQQLALQKFCNRIVHKLYATVMTRKIIARCWSLKLFKSCFVRRRVPPLWSRHFLRTSTAECATHKGRQKWLLPHIAICNYAIPLLNGKRRQTTFNCCIPADS